MFTSGLDVVVVKQTSEKDWQILASLEYTANDRTFRVQAGEFTDFASTPRIFAWLIPSYGKYTLAGILHDHLWRIEIPAGNISYRDADGIFRQAMRRLGVPFATRWAMWTAVRWGALFRPGGAAGWWQDAPAVLLWSLLAAAVAFCGVAGVSVSLAVLWLLELAVWPVLLIGRTLQWIRGRTPKKVNAPVVTIKT